MLTTTHSQKLFDQFTALTPPFKHHGEKGEDIRGRSISRLDPCY